MSSTRNHTGCPMPRGLNWQTLELPFVAGLQQRTDDRARPQPYLDICRDVQLDEIGGVQPRLPYAAMSNSIFGGGTLSNCRKLAVVNGELCVFTDTALYSWNAQLAVWVNRGTHLAAVVTETPRFVSTGDQILADRAELNGTVVWTWTELSGAIGGNMFAAAIDKTTGSVLMAPTLIGSGGLSSRLVALATKILLFTLEAAAVNTTLNVRALDPANPLTGVQSAATAVSVADPGLSYDVVRVLGADQAVGARVLRTTSQYVVFTVTAGLTIATSTKARTADGVIAVASRPSAGAQTHIFRSVTGTTQIIGDVVTTSTLADVATAQIIGTFTAPINHVTACYRSVQTSGHFVCRAIWNARESSDPAPEIKSNTVDDAGTIGTQATFVGGLGVASRAFDYNGTVYVWLVFAQTNQAVTSAGADLQNTYFLYNESGALTSKAVPDVAGGYDTPPPRPMVAASGTALVWAAARRRSLVTASSPSGFAVAGGRVYAARSLVDVALSFDSNEARRVAVLGRTAYISGGEILAYDGVQIVECGFNIFGYSFAPTDAGAGAGSLAAGAYSYKSTLRYMNAQREAERSTTAAISDVTIAAATSTMSAPSGSGPLYTTRKTSPAPAFEVWRTPVNAGDDAPYFLASSIDPNATTNPNRYLPNAVPIAAFTDTLSDAVLKTKEANPENGPTLEALAPPGATIIIATDTRIFLAGVSGDPDRVWYSRERGADEIASFHDELTIDVPGRGGDIKAIWFQSETLYVARQTALYSFPGSPLDNNGDGAGFGPARIVSSDVGAVSQESVALTPNGTIFQSRKGWQLLARDGMTVEYIGGPVSDFDTDTVLAVQVVETQQHVRILTSARMIVWFYGVNQWGEWTIADGLHAVMWNGSHVYLTATGPKLQGAAYSSLTYGLDVERAWITPAQLHGFAAVGRVQPAGEYRSAHLLRLRMKYNFDETVVDDVIWSPSPTVVGGLLQMAHGPRFRFCQAFKVRFTAVAAGVQATLATVSALSAQVNTSGTAWAATWAAKSGSNLVIGELGNKVTMSLGFESGSPNVIDVRDHFSYSPATATWTPDVNNVGVRVVGSIASVTVAALETAIAAGTALVQLSAADATPSKTINMDPLDLSSMVLSLVTGQLTGGTFTAPTGEALKLTGIGFDIGTMPGVYKRLAPAQEV